MKRNVLLISFLALVFTSSMLGALVVFRPKKSAILSLQTFSSPHISSTSLKEYNNARFGFSFFYPQEMSISQSSLSMIKVVQKDTQEEIATLQFITFSSGSFDSFVRKQLSILCSTFNKDEKTVTFCPAIDRQQTFTTKEGITGSIYYLVEVKKDNISQKEVSKIIKGPFFVFDLTSQIASGQALLLMYPSIQKKQDADNVDLLRRFAEGIRLEKKKVRGIQIPLSPSSHTSISSPSQNF